jgi:hypothetical protein
VHSIDEYPLSLKKSSSKIYAFQPVVIDPDQPPNLSFVFLKPGTLLDKKIMLNIAETSCIHSAKQAVLPDMEVLQDIVVKVNDD